MIELVHRRHLLEAPSLKRHFDLINDYSLPRNLSCVHPSNDILRLLQRLQIKSRYPWSRQILMKDAVFDV